jgi:hypothetical protein
MSDKLTYRDILVYALNGLIGLILIGFIYRENIQDYVFEKEIKNSEFIFLILIPFCYLFGHIILSIDNLFFMRILTKKIRTNLLKSEYRFFKWIHCIVFRYRIVGVRDIRWTKENGDFGLICTILRNEGKFGQADRNYILSDFFKGLIIIELFVIIVTAIKSDWCYFFTSIILFVLFYLRARKFSNEYVSEILRQSKLIK